MKPVTLTEKAIDRIKQILEEKKIPDFYGIRIGVEGGGCTGFQSNILGFDIVKDNDITYEQDGITIYIDKRQVMFLAGTTIDFLEEEKQQGFVFEK